MKRIYIILLLLIFVVLICCNRHTEAWNQLDLAEHIMPTKPDSALAILDKIDSKTLATGEETARYALLMSMALDKNNIDTASFDVLQPAIDYYPRHGTADEKLKTFFYKGRIYQNRQRLDSAMQCYLQAEEYCVEAKDAFAKAILYVWQGSIYRNTFHIDEYVNANKIASRLYRSIDRPDREIMCLANIVHGCILDSNKKLADSALLEADRCIQLKNSLAHEISKQRFGYTLYLADKNEMVDTLKKYLEPHTSTEDKNLDLAYAYCKLGNMNKSLRFMNAVQRDTDADKLMRYTIIKAEILDSIGDTAGALTEYKKYLNLCDSITSELLFDDLLFANQKHQLEKAKMEEKAEKEKWIWASACIGLFVIALAIYILYRRRVVKIKDAIKQQEKRNLELEAENLQKETAALNLEKENAQLAAQKAKLEANENARKAEKLRAALEELQEEKNSLDNILKKKANLAEPISKAVRERLEALNDMLAARISHKGDEKTYAEMVEKIVADNNHFMESNTLAFDATHPRFIAHLKECGLDDNEINYTCLYALGLRGKDVGDYMRLQRHYHVSSGIRKKLGLDSHGNNLGIYIRKLLASYSD